MTPPNARSVCIVGGGLTGMVLGRKLALDGHRVSVLESGPELGGLATWHDFGGFVWDRFYHVILPTDTHLIGLVHDLGLDSELHWARTRTGFYVDDRLHSISDNMEFLRFPLLSLVSKGRLAWTMLRAARIDDWRSLETITVDRWLIRMSGQETFDKLWKPLLLAKLGPHYRRVSAVFIWSYIKRLFSAREGSANAEHLGHVTGGYRRVFEKLRSAIESAGGSVETGCRVERIAPIDASSIGVQVSGESRRFDQVICTAPASVLRQTVDAELLVIDEPSVTTEYLGVVCVVVVSTVPISPYYVINVADENLPFTGVIGLSNVMPPEHTGGRYVTYLPKYLLSTEAEFDADDEHFERSFLAGLKVMFPTFDDASVVSVHVNRARRVQPLQVLNYSRTVPAARSRHPGLFVLNTTQFVNATLNNNEVVKAVDAFHAEHARSTGGVDARASVGPGRAA